MRYHHSYSNIQWRLNLGESLFRPYQDQYINSYKNSHFEKACLKKTYVKVLQYIADHDGCKRVDINIALFGWNRDVKLEKNDIKKIAYWSRGQHSNMYSQLLYLDLIDYDKKFHYHITDKGREILKKAYLNEMAKLVMNKGK